jgi:hypothetical protein
MRTVGSMVFAALILIVAPSARAVTYDVEVDNGYLSEHIAQKENGLDH